MLEKTALLCASFLLLAVSSAIAQGPAPPPPQPLGNPPVPAGNPITTAKTNLGKTLFWDEQLSSTRTISCGTCHQPDTGGSDPRSAIGDLRSTHPGPDETAETGDDITGSPGVVYSNADGTYGLEDFFGMTAQVTGRYAPTVINAAFVPELFWDGRAKTEFVDPISGNTVLGAGAALESQAAGPPVSGAEMGHQARDWNAVAARVSGARPLALSPEIPADLETWIAGRNYPALFGDAFGDTSVTPSHILMAIATYERTLISNQAPIDSFFGGNNNALTAQEQQGLQLFRTSNCVACHGGNRFTDDNFHYIGVRPQNDDLGRFNVTGVNGDRGRMKTPTLRNVELRGEHMHNGRFSSLEEVVDFYNRGGDFDAPNKNNNIQPLGLTDTEKAALVAFLGRPLTDPRVASESGPFTRPGLFSGSDLQAAIGSDIVEDDEGNSPRIVAIEPALGGSPNFTVGLHEVPAGRRVYLAIDDSPIPSGTGIPHADEVRMFFDLTTEDDGTGNGYLSQTIAIPGGHSLDSTKLYGKWFISGDGSPGESATFETAVFGEAAGDLLPPANLTASDNTSSSEISLSWDEATGATTYDVYRGETGAFVDARLIGSTDTAGYSDTEVAAESVYYYWIVSVNDHEASAPSDPETGSTYDLTGFTLNATDSTSASGTTLSWVPLAPIGEYDIYRGTTSDPISMSFLASTADITYVDTTGDAARTYYYRVIWKIGGNFADNSTIDGGTRALATPASVAASYNTFRDRIEVTWTGTSDATGYLVYREQNPGGTREQIADTTLTTYEDYSASVAEEYSYSIVASNDYGISSESATATGYRAVSPPTGITATFGEEVGQVTIAWTVAAPVANYAVFRSLTHNFDDAEEIALVVNGSSYVDSTVEEGLTYYYWVASVDESNERIVEIADVTTGSSGELTPDLLIGKTSSNLKGDSIYNDTGSGQALSNLTRHYRPFEITLRAENDGSTDDSFVYSGPSGNRFFKYRYTRNSPSPANLTASVKTGKAADNSVSPGGAELLTIQVKPIRSKQRNKNRTYRHTAYLRLSSAYDGSETDCVKLKAKARY